MSANESLKSTAHRAGLLYLVFAIVAIIQQFFFPTFVVSGDPAATAQNIIEQENVYRVHILAGFVTLIFHLLVAWVFYSLLRNVDRKQARLMVLFVTVGVAVAIANQLNKIAPLVLLSGSDYFSEFTKPQLNALVMAFIRLHSNGGYLTGFFWGLWLFPFGILVIRSGFVPRIFGYLLLVAGLGYVVNSAASIALPDYRQIVSQVMMPLYFGELPIIFWLMFKGVVVTSNERE